MPGVRWTRKVATHSTARLNGRASVASRKQRRLDFRWRLVKRPRGSRAVLRHVRSPVARLRPDRPGRYVAQLQLSERRKGARAAGATSPSMNVSLQAPPYVPPYGHALSLDPVTGVTTPGTSFAPAASPGSMIVARISNTTTGLDEELSIPPVGGTRDLATLVSTVASIDIPDDLIVIIGNQASPEPQGGATTNALAAVSSMLQTLGLSEADANDAARRMGNGAPFSFIGLPGGAEGSGAGNFFDGQLNGYLRFTGLTSNLTGQVMFEQTDYRLFAFNGADQFTTITAVNPAAGTQPTQAVDIPAPSGAMSVTVLDAVTLAKVTSATNSPGGQNGAAAPVRGVLSQYAGDPSKLILFKSIGASAWENTRDDMANIMDSLTSLGANKDAFTRSLYYGSGRNTLNPYVFFGGAGVSPVEGSAFDAVDPSSSAGNPIPVSSPAMTGVLKRDQQGRWAPSGASPYPLDRDLQAITVMPPTQYGYPSDPPGTPQQYAAAEQALFQKLDAAKPSPFCDVKNKNCNLRSGIRVNYANPQLLDNLVTVQGILKCSSQPSTNTDAPSGDYTPEQLGALTTMICGELANLDTIHSQFFEIMIKEILPSVATNSQNDLTGATTGLLGFLGDEENAELEDRSEFLGISGEAGGILEELVLSAVSVATLASAPELGPALGDLTAGVLGVSSDTLGLAGEAVGASGDAEHTAAAEVTAANLYGYLSTTYAYAAARMKEAEAIVNTDPAKVRAVFKKVNGGDWNLQQLLPNSDIYTAQDAVLFHQQAAAQQYLWPRIISAVAKPCDTGGSASDPTTYQAFTKIKEASVTGPEPNYLAFEQHYLRGAHVDAADAKTLAGLLFGPSFRPGDVFTATPKGAGLARSPFYMVQIAPTSTSRAPDCNEDTFGPRAAAATRRSRSAP